jgi:hypothetical protein
MHLSSPCTSKHAKPHAHTSNTMLAVTSAAAVRPAVVRASAAGKRSKRASSKAAVVPKKNVVLLGALSSVPASIPAVAFAFDKEQAESIAKNIEDDGQAFLSLFNRGAEAVNAVGAVQVEFS